MGLEFLRRVHLVLGAFVSFGGLASLGALGAFGVVVIPPGVLVVSIDICIASAIIEMVLPCQSAHQYMSSRRSLYLIGTLTAAGAARFHGYTGLLKLESGRVE